MNTVVQDPRMGELHQMGLASHWLNLAERIGYDAFLEVWASLDAVRDPQNSLLSIPPFRTYHRYQRNQTIFSLRETGQSPEQISRIITRRLGQSISPRQVLRLITQHQQTPSQRHSAIC